MNRREFCRNLALITGGTLVLPEQVDALTQTYVRSTGHIREDQLIAVQDITFGFGGMPRDLTQIVTFYNGEAVLLQIPVNYRSTFRWVAGPTTPMLSSLEDFYWDVKGEGECGEDLLGNIMWVDSTGKIRVNMIKGPGRLVPAQSMRLETV